MPFPCRATNMPFAAGSWQGAGMQTAWEWNVGDLPAVGVFLLPRGVPGSLLSEAGEWHGRGRFVAESRHGMCESGFNTAGERYGNGMVCVNPPLQALTGPEVSRRLKLPDFKTIGT